MHKRYLGDGVYVSFDGFGLTLTTENGIAVTNVIYLEPQVLEALNKYVADIAASVPKGDAVVPS